MKKKPIAPLLLALAIVAAAVVVLDLTGGSMVAEDVCVVKAVAPAPNEANAPMRIASVQLPGGALVPAKVVRVAELRAGEKVRVAVRRRLIGGAPSYEVVGTAAADD